jgi:hypothetical protein
MQLILLRVFSSVLLGHSELVWIPIDRISESQDPSQHIDYWPAVIKEVCYVARTAGWEYVCIAVGLNQ